jgi:uncharacterized protein YcsI (UPF0317 family)
MSSTDDTRPGTGVSAVNADGEIPAFWQTGTV